VINRAVTGLLTTGIILLLCSGAYADHRRKPPAPFDAYVFSDSRAYADDGRYPYGGYGKGRYGARRMVNTEDEAQVIMREYFPDNNLKIGKIKKKKMYFEADITDRHGKVVDRVIIDKRTGRIRSVY